MYVYTGGLLQQQKTNWRMSARYIDEGIITPRNLYIPFVARVRDTRVTREKETQKKNAWHTNETTEEGSLFPSLLSQSRPEHP